MTFLPFQLGDGTGGQSMILNFSKASKALTRTDIAEVETKLGLQFPQSLTEHYLKYNGGKPSKTYFYSEESGIEIDIQIFAPIKYRYSECDQLKTVEEKYTFFKGISELMSEYLPFANDYGGNPICVNVKTGKVYIVWMDLGEITQRCFRYLAENFDEFISGLTKQSIDD